MTFSSNDIVTSASDELGMAMATIRSRALTAVGSEREALLNEYKRLSRKQEKLIVADIRTLIDSASVRDTLNQLSVQVQELVKVRREMAEATKITEKVTQALGIVDVILKALIAIGVIGV
ncbi:hypothetical protein P5705_08390 [Pseudomonas entomophila]|uniref:hypothetical protein n=1 Tax=Pseudomonas entomophila TaxID=312306 RepID=UPI002406DB5E|nr:hypothetical protein [Pseudomonas entomophila]MDF9617657.1 hypothetical protein [Pseudomonas entomophila]